MVPVPSPSTFRQLQRAEQEQLFLDILKSPGFTHAGTWGEWFHAWLEDQSAEGRTLGQIAARLDLPSYRDGDAKDPWEFLERHVGWLIEQGLARVVRIEVIG